MRTYVFINWTSGDGIHVARITMDDDQWALAQLATYGLGYTCEEALQAGSRCIG